MILTLVPVGRIETALLLRLGERLTGTLPFDRFVLGDLLDPSFALDRERGQYASTHLLGALRRIEVGSGRVLGVLEGDLFIPVLTFVYGEADLSGTAAVFSLQRLRPEFFGIPPDPDLLLERALKEAMHEIGHTFGLTHCPRADCAMRASTDAGQVDLKPASFCRGCRAVVSASSLRRSEGT